VPVALIVSSSDAVAPVSGAIVPDTDTPVVGDTPQQKYPRLNVFVVDGTVTRALGRAA